MTDIKTIIFFRTIGDSTFGMGHLYRSITLAKVILTEKKHYSVVFIFRDNESNLIKMVKKDGFEYVLFKNLASYLNKSSCNVGLFYENLLIYDMPCLEEDVISTFNLHDNSKVIGLDYFYAERVDIALNLFTHNRQQSMSYKIKESIEFVLLNENILTTTKSTAIAVSALSKVLITFGSTDPKNNTLKVLNQLTAFSGEITIILGSLYKFHYELKSFLFRHQKLKVNIIENPKGIGRFIHEAELVFCGGGTTLLECIHIATPSCVIAQTDAEQNFANFLQGKGLCYVNDFKLPSKIERTVLQNNCLEINIGQGAQLIIKNMEDMLNV